MPAKNAVWSAAFFSPGSKNYQFRVLQECKTVFKLVPVNTAYPCRHIKTKLLLMILDSGQQPLPNNPIEWVPAKAILKWFDISKETLKNWRRNGTILYKKIGGICMYNKTDLDKRLGDGENIV